jgi:adenylate cyclase
MPEMPEMPDFKSLRSLSPPQLIDIIGRQQQLIQQLVYQIPDMSTAASILAQTNWTEWPQLCPSPSASTAATPYLIIQREKRSSYTVTMDYGTCWTIGRDPQNAIVLIDQWMSRNHALLQMMETGEFYIFDLGSRNGTFVNGRRINIPTALHHGDLITFGQTNLHFHEDSHPLESSMRHLDSTPVSPEPDEVMMTDVLHIRRQISVLVVDIRNFTRLTRQLDEQVLSDLVGTWFRYAGNIIRNHGSWMDKYIGDAVMAVWIHGTWDVKPEDIRNPFEALVALQQMTSHLHEEFGLPTPIQIGAGLNTGSAMVGNTGSGDRPDYTALGDTVNAAFRLESSTKQLGVDLALGCTTYQYLQQWLGNPLPFQESMLHLKGYDTPTTAYTCTFANLSQALPFSPLEPNGSH